MISTNELKKLYVSILDMYPGDNVIWHKKQVLYLIEKLIKQSEKNDVENINE